MNWKVEDADVDYYAATTADPLCGHELLARGYAIVESLGFGMDGVTAVREQNYVGVGVEGVFVGERDDGCYIRLSGLHARYYWADFAAMGCRASRFDFQITARTEAPDNTVAERARDRLLLLRSSGTSVPKITFYSTKPGGDTLYIGSPKSDTRARLYDKYAERPEDYQPGAWRWELQTRHDRARALCGTLLLSQSPVDDGYAAVASHFHCLGLTPPFPFTLDTGALRVTREHTDNVRRLRWLRRCVAPMIERMKAEYSIDSLREAVGLLYVNRAGRPTYRK